MKQQLKGKKLSKNKKNKSNPSQKNKLFSVILPFVAVLLAGAFVVGLIWLRSPIPTVISKTYQWTQTDWSGGQDQTGSGYVTHSVPPTSSWGKFWQKAADLAASATALSLSETAYWIKDDGSFSCSSGDCGTQGATPVVDEGDGSDGAFDDTSAEPTGLAGYVNGGTGSCSASYDYCFDTDNATKNGTYNFSSITLTKNVHAFGSNPLTLYSTGDVSVTGTLDASGASVPTSLGAPGGAAGAGGSSGGDSKADGNGIGKGGSGSSNAGGGGAGFGATGGKAGSSGVGGGNPGGIYNTVNSGGSGGAGGYYSYTQGVGGGGGGGVLKIITNGTITNSGTISANGGNGGTPATYVYLSTNYSYGSGGGAGSGGRITLVAGTITNSGTISANGGNGGNVQTTEMIGPGGGGGAGRIELFANNITAGTTSLSGGSAGTGGTNNASAGSNGSLVSASLGFYSGTVSNTVVTGSGAGASISLASNLGLTSGLSWQNLTSYGNAITNRYRFTDPINGSIYSFELFSTRVRKYVISTDSWAPIVFSDITLPVDNNFVVIGTDTIYAANSNLWRYTISTNTWTNLGAPPEANLYLAAVDTNTIYGFSPSGGSKSVYTYNIGTGTWSADLAPSGNHYNSTCDVVAVGTDTFYTAACNTVGQDFDKYTISTNSWSNLTPSPFSSWSGNVHKRLAVAFNDSNSIYAVSSSLTDNYFFKYNISSNSWSGLTETGVQLNNYGSIINGTDEVYIIQGDGSPALWKYNINSYQSSGSFSSSVVDVGF